jgi:regulator of protease activity HflC (stomatin/prohibitin superfamily)
VGNLIPDWVNVGNGLLLFFGIVAIVMFFSCFFTVHTKQAGVIEKWGKFNRIAAPGLNFKLPFLESLVYTEDLNMQLMDVPVVSKTKDDATITIPVRVQYFVLPDKVKEAYYELDDPEVQIKAHVENVILGYIPKVNLDDTYQQEDLIAKKVKESLSEVMSRFGYSIENALVTSIIPSKEVLAAMNNINTQRRERVATEAKAEADKIVMIKKAEAEKQAQILAGEGVAGEQKAIVDGLRDSLKDFEQGVEGVSPQAAMVLIMMARYFDALKEIGADSNTILLPHSPSTVIDLQAQMREAILSGNLASRRD